MTSQVVGPLRKIGAVTRFYKGGFYPDGHILECGHHVSTRAQYHARCSECAQGIEGPDGCATRGGPTDE